MAQKLYEESNIQAIANAIRGKNGLTTTYKPSEMAAAITAIEGGGGTGGDLPEQAFTITGNCSYRFANNGWNWFIENYGDRVTTANISNANNMFYNADELINVPFELNFTTGANHHDTSAIFNSCRKLESLPTMNNIIFYNGNLFGQCYMLRYIQEFPNEAFSYWKTISSLSCSSIFEMCYSLREIPVCFFNALKDCKMNTSYSIYSGAFKFCYSLNELTNLPLKFNKDELTSSAILGGASYAPCFQELYRCKNIIYTKNDDGSIVTLKAKSQVLDYSKYLGYANTSSKSNILNYNSGITADKEVTDDATYQALKDDPDWFTCNVAYSRYNHDSAVATINSLPDTSAYLATAGGTNTIKFKGASGASTDGGAINTLAETEIAVATAKGWSVVYV